MVDGVQRFALKSIDALQQIREHRLRLNKERFSFPCYQERFVLQRRRRRTWRSAFSLREMYASRRSLSVLEWRVMSYFITNVRILI